MIYNKLILQKLLKLCFRKYVEIKKMESATLYNSTLHVAYV